MNSIKQFEKVFGITINKNKHHEIMAMLVCFELVLALSYIGYIQIAPISVTTLHIFVIVAAMFFGPLDASVIAFVFGLTSMWKASVTCIEIGDVIFSPILSGKPFASIFMAMICRIIFAVVAGYAFRWYFSRERKNRYFGIILISIVTTIIHSALIYGCMLVFFDAAETETSASFNELLILNNLILYAVTAAVVVLLYKLGFASSVEEFLKKTSAEENEIRKRKSKTVVILYISILLCCIFIVLHFMSRLGWYITNHGENASPDYINWTYSLVIQFLVGFAGVFGILFIFVRWVQEYYSALTLEANILARESAESANESKTSFLFNMSHDIRTPMNAILGYTNIGLLHSDDEEKVIDSLNKIKLSGDHLLRLINDILEMSRIESGKLILADNPLDIRESIKSVDLMSQALAAPKNIEYETNTDGITTPYICTDELHLNEVLINLVSNAIKYTNEGGHVELNVIQLGDPENGEVTYRFEVSDNGIGMSEDFQKHLFEAFTRENKTTVAKTEGSGLGLSIVKRIVDMSGGTINVSSVQGQGTVFTVDLPFKVMDEDTKAAYVAAQEKISVIDTDIALEGRKILLVEDNEMNREIATEILEEAGIMVETAENGLEAVQILTEKGVHCFDFILMDIQMPIMDGFEATSVIRKLPDGSEIPIIALSANAFKEDIDKSISAGMNAHVAKPINIEKLLSTLHSLAK